MAMRKLYKRGLLLVVAAVLAGIPALAQTQVSLEVDPEISEGTAGHYYVNMPQTGWNALTITSSDLSAGKGTFKVYDDGGKSGHYSQACNGTLTLTVPSGHRVFLEGDAKTSLSGSTLTVYDGANASGVKLVEDAHSISSIDPATIYTASTGRSMTLVFVSDINWDAHHGLDLTVTVFDPSLTYGISNATASSYGSIGFKVNGATVSKAHPGDRVSIVSSNITTGYVLSDLTVTDSNERAIPVSIEGNSAQFIMPLAAVTVTATFDKAQYDVAIPGGGTTSTFNIPRGPVTVDINEFEGNNTELYHTVENVKGTLVLVAPARRQIRLTGKVVTHYTGSSIGIGLSPNYQPFLAKFIAWDGYSSSGNTLAVFEYTGSSNKTYTVEKDGVYSVTSSGQIMTLDMAKQMFDSVTPNLTAKAGRVVEVAGNIVGGTVTLDTDFASDGETVTVTATPAEGYGLAYVFYNDGTGSIPIEPDNEGVYSFEIPNNKAAKFTVSARFLSDLVLTPREARFAGQKRYWTSFYHPTLNFRLSEGAIAFTMHYQGGNKVLHTVEDGSLIPKGCAVIIMSDVPSVTLNVTTDTATPESNNILRGVSVNKSVSELVPSGYNVYVMGSNNAEFGFFRFSGQTIPANKAYYVEQ